MRKSPGLPAGRAEGFPVKGELCLRATSLLIDHGDETIVAGLRSIGSVDPLRDFCDSVGVKYFMTAASWVMKYRSEEHTSELQSLTNLVCRLLLAKKNDLMVSEDAQQQDEGKRSQYNVLCAVPGHAP